MASVYFSDNLGTLRQIGDAAQWQDCMKIIINDSIQQKRIVLLLMLVLILNILKYGA